MNKAKTQYIPSSMKWCLTQIMEEWHNILLNTNITYAGITMNDFCIMLSIYAQIQNPNENMTFFYPECPNPT